MQVCIYYMPTNSLQKKQKTTKQMTDWLTNQQTDNCMIFFSHIIVVSRSHCNSAILFSFFSTFCHPWTFFVKFSYISEKTCEDFIYTCHDLIFFLSFFHRFLPVINIFFFLSYFKNSIHKYLVGIIFIIKITKKYRLI